MRPAPRRPPGGAWTSTSPLSTWMLIGGSLALLRSGRWCVNSDAEPSAGSLDGDPAEVARIGDRSSASRTLSEDVAIAVSVSLDVYRAAALEHRRRQVAGLGLNHLIHAPVRRRRGAAGTGHLRRRRLLAMGNPAPCIAGEGPGWTNPPPQAQNAGEAHTGHAGTRPSTAPATANISQHHCTGQASPQRVR